ncbi:hydrogenase maturation protease [Streptomyces sp. XD-27]|uniref:hydrogenase maturation protease n=1 Tax=Streptomyces sp. XD-27 TaxID=3062779 RepID=UPI0026F44002|nr:hydrogenase maturation protease [Streptomyces sp. XD-27]WKX68997.1 hydrogenase maturation protease [Streptomyces sp. XD-27]
MGTAPRIAVIGVGDTSRRDDGVAFSVTARLAARAADRPLPPGTEVTACDGDPARLTRLWEDAGLAIVVDATFADPEHPGLIHRQELDRHELRSGTPRIRSAHGLGIDEAVELSGALGRLPGHLVVYTVQGADSALGTGLSVPVTAAVEPLAERVEAEIVRHRDAAARGTPWGG